MQKTSKPTITNRTLFALLVATVVIPLPAMTPALLSSAMGAMSLVSAAPSARPTMVPVYFLPARAPNAPPILMPETVVLSMSDPATVISETGVERAMPFEDLRIPAILEFQPRMPGLLAWLGRPSGGGGVTSRDLPPSAVPEPATWAMLIIGFMTAGGMIRRRRRIAAAALA